MRSYKYLIYNNLNMITKIKLYLAWYIKPEVDRIGDFTRRQEGTWKFFTSQVARIWGLSIPAPVVEISGTVLRLVKFLILKIVNFLASVVILVVNRRQKKFRYYEINQWPV
jgi:hypothetical protein